ncbi:MAG: DUF1800 family protein [Saprospiraceae bacterium]|nr:DUF1800 family protein [Saprospiraceae bacterium]
MSKNFVLIIYLLCAVALAAQPDTLTIGFGEYHGVMVSASSSHNYPPETTLKQDGYLPNLNASSRFLGQATLGYNMEDLQEVSEMGIEDWIDSQFVKPIPFSLKNKVKDYHNFVKTATNTPAAGQIYRMWSYAWWQYHMASADVLRQRVAMALSELFVVSDKSAFGGNSYALSSYYDVMLNNAFTNYRDLMEDVTFHPAMGVYLTFLNNPKSNPATNQFPDENYARELMQLFTIGTSKLNMDGSYVLGTNGQPIQTYNNTDIAEFAKVFTGLSWADRTTFNRSAANDTSYTLPMIMFNSSHETGVKNLLNGFVVPNRVPTDGIADIQDAISNLFNHSNTPPFVAKFLIQRLVTSNPSPDYIERVANVFVNNGQGVRGDMKAIIKAILLDPEAKSCKSGNDVEYGALREPFVRYVQINKAFDASTASGNYRNDMDYVYRFVQQKPLTSPSVFNFFQQEYQPIGPIEEADLVGPEFQITNAQTIMGYVNSLYRFVIQENVADEYDLYTNEDDATYANEVSTIDLNDEVLLTDNNKLHILLDRLNLLLAQGRLTASSLAIIKNVVTELPNGTATEKRDRVRLAIYLIMSSPEYLINR